LGKVKRNGQSKEGGKELHQAAFASRGTQENLCLLVGGVRKHNECDGGSLEKKPGGGTRGGSERKAQDLSHAGENFAENKRNGKGRRKIGKKGEKTE